MLIALTGATGFIGRRVCSVLLQAGHTVRAIVRDPARATPLDPAIQLIRGDLSNGEALQQLVHGADAVLHLAGAVRGADAAPFQAVNVDGTAQLLAALDTSAPALPLLYFSSLAAREPQLSHYARSKHDAEVLVRARCTSRPHCIIRPPAVYGPGDREMLPVFRFMARTGLAPCAGRASSRLSLLYVDDLATAVLAWLGEREHNHGTLELDDGHAHAYDWQELAAQVAQVAGRTIKVWEIPAWLLDLPAAGNAMLARLLGYAPMLTPEKLRELRHPDWTCNNLAISATLRWQPTRTLSQGLANTPGWRD